MLIGGYATPTGAAFTSAQTLPIPAATLGGTVSVGIYRVDTP